MNCEQALTQKLHPIPRIYGSPAFGRWAWKSLKVFGWEGHRRKSNAAKWKEEYKDGKIGAVLR